MGVGTVTGSLRIGRTYARLRPLSVTGSFPLSVRIHDRWLASAGRAAAAGGRVIRRAPLSWATFATTDSQHISPGNRLLGVELPGF